MTDTIVDIQSGPKGQSNNGGSVDVIVRPFQHQVGGHMCVLEVTKHVICKPFQDKEVQFYNNATPELKEFIPEYLGQTKIRLFTSNNKQVYIASIPRAIYDVCHFDINYEDINDGSKSDLTKWSKTCADRQKNRYGYWSDNNSSQDFVLLKNLVGSYKLPCILDLKMGTRQYGEDSDPDKRKLLQDRCANSTSATLGLRICGIQVYKADTDKYVCRDKYHGRNLNDAGVQSELNGFFHDGQQFRKSEISSIVNKLKRLHTTLKEQTTFIFFSCSLLIMYESDVNSLCSNSSGVVKLVDSPGDGPSMGSESCEFTPKIDVRLIDFAHTEQRCNITENPEDSDEGILFGLENLIHIMQSILEEHLN